MRLAFDDPMTPSLGMRLDLWISISGDLLPSVPRDPWEMMGRSPRIVEKDGQVFRHFRFSVPIADIAREVPLRLLCDTVCDVWWKMIYPNIPHPRPDQAFSSWVRMGEWGGAPHGVVFRGE